MLWNFKLNIVRNYFYIALEVTYVHKFYLSNIFSYLNKFLLRPRWLYVLAAYQWGTKASWSSEVIVAGNLVVQVVVVRQIFNIFNVSYIFTDKWSYLVSSRYPLSIWKYYANVEVNQFCKLSKGLCYNFEA